VLQKEMKQLPSWKTNIAIAGISPFSIGNTSSNGPFSIAMLVYWSVFIETHL